MPGVPERTSNDLPLAALFTQRVLALTGDAVVPAPATAPWRVPRRLNVAKAVQTVQQRVQHPVGPLHLATGQLIDALENGVTIALAFVQDG